MNFSGWNEYLKSKFCVKRKDVKNHIYKSDNMKSEVVNFTGYEFFRVLEIKANWMKIGYHKITTETLIDGEVMTLGWIQWRDSNSLLIEYFNN